MSRAGAVLLLLLAGCLQSNAIQCDDGRICPSGTTCDDTHGLCLLPSQTDACAGKADNDVCRFGDQVGLCEGGVCVPSACGNGVTDPGELCDDSNTLGGDGCSADCKKLEACGDGVLDVGEQCDDANANPADGCDGCKLTLWTTTAVIGTAAAGATISLALPSGVAVDAAGRVFIADAANGRIRRVDPDGTVTTVAGSILGFSGDGGVATSARLRLPNGVAVDGLGQIFIADTANHRIRRVDVSGTITTVAGTGVAGSAGDGGAATLAQLRSPNAVVVDGLGRIYVADTGNQKIRRVELDGTIVTIAGTGVAGFSGDGGVATNAQFRGPSSIAVDSLGQVVIADSLNSRIRRIDTAGVITTIAGTGVAGFSGDGMAATSAQLRLPQGVALRGAEILIADSFNQRIRAIDATGTITTIAGNGTMGSSGDGGPATGATLSRPSGVAADGTGRVIVADTANNTVRRIDTTGTITAIAGSGARYAGDGSAATSAMLFAPSGVAIDVTDRLIIADTNNNRIRRVELDGTIATVAGTGLPGFLGDGGAATDARLAAPARVAIDSVGRVVIADTGNHCVRRIELDNTITTIAGTGVAGFSGDGSPATAAQLHSPTGVAIDSLGRVVIADTTNNRLRRIELDNTITTIAGDGIAGFVGEGTPATSAELDAPADVAIDSAGRVVIADTKNHRVRRIELDGTITTIAGDGTPAFFGDGGLATSAELDSPAGVAIDQLGRVIVADTNNHRLRRIALDGTIATIAGVLPLILDGFDGDGGAASAAMLNGPLGVAVDSSGRVFVADATNFRIRRIDPSGTIFTAAGQVAPEGMGPLANAHLANPQSIVIAASMTLFAGGSSGTVQAIRAGTTTLAAVAGWYVQWTATANLARFRSLTFGTVSGVAYDEAAGEIYLSESSANTLHVVTIVDLTNPDTWTIAPLANATGTAGFADGPAATARFRNPTGLFLDATAHVLYVADTGNHVIRAIDLATSMVRTVAGTGATRGFFGDGDVATNALLFEPQAITKCANGDLFVADTGNNRVRRITAGANVISTVLGDGSVSSSGEGSPASNFPVNGPLGIACDTIGNVYVTSTTTVREVTADANGVVDGSGAALTIYGGPPRDTFPASATTCLTGLAIVDATNVQVVDSCAGLLVNLRRGSK